jgi:ribose transport system ATP-binding protein
MSVLSVEDLVMEFQSVRALSGVSIGFEAGEVHGIVGENGAGKSTLMKILSGVQRPTSGKVLLRGQAIRFDGVRDAQAHGIAMIHQELNLVDELAVFENIYLGREVVRAGLLDRKVMIKNADEVLRQVHANFDATTPVRELSVAGKQLVEIAKALATEASILIMDEPTAVLSDPEAQSLFALIAALKARGVTVLYISHRLSEVCEICDRITVLRDGSKIETVRAKDSDAADLARLMVGRELGDFYPPKSPVLGGEVVLEVRNVRGATFSIRAGEIVGLAGLVGAGRTELAEAVFGASSRADGEVKVAGRSCRIGNPKQAIRCGIGYVSEDRKHIGLLTSLSSVKNITLANLKHYGDVVLDNRAEERSAADWKAALDIRAGDLEEATANLSGGNQQKISIAKWLETKPTVLILDEPTRGVDVGAKREIYTLIHKLASEGMAFLVISSELPEIIGLCHRTMVMREGRIVGELTGDALTEDGAMQLAAGVQAA